MHALAKITKIAALAAVVWLSASSQAIVLNPSMSDPSTLGIVVPEKPANPSDEEFYINKLLSLGLNGVFNIDNPPLNNPKNDVKITRSGNTFSGLPATLTPGDNSGNINVGSPGFTASGSGWDFVLAKYGNNAIVWVVNGAAFTVPSLGSPQWTSGNGLSHWIGLNTHHNPPTVPDGGASAALLGIGSLAVAAYRRRKS